MDQGYAYIAGAMSMDGWLAFAGIRMEDGFVRDEMKSN